jgi:transposase
MYSRQARFTPTTRQCRYSLPATGKTKTGRLWTYVRDDRPCGDTAPPAAWFAFSPYRRGEHPQGHLKSFQGTLQADAYAGFHPLYEGGRILEAACWAHARRKFHDILAATQSPTASEAIGRTGELYAIEKEVRGSPPEIRLAIRQARARPVIEGLRAWFDATLQTLSAKSDMAGAIRYAISRWTALTRYLDNNAAERALRVVALGRKIISSRDRTGEANAPPPSTRSSDRPSSTGSTRSFIFAMSSPESQITQ